MGAAQGDEIPSFPERVGRYELLLPIGAGGMATVYLARVHVVGDVYRQVALKLLHPFVKVGSDEGTRALIEEAKLAVRIRHPNVVPVVEVGDGPAGVFLVMEYIEGDTLSGISRSIRTQNKTLPLAVAGRVLLDALAGLHAAHELKDEEGRSLQLVHRDFSPQNILIGTDGVSRLTDFGVAKAEDRLQVTSSGVIKGKVSYMPPEQALGKTLDRRCDVWAAGVVAWEILAGQRLYKEQDNIATLVKIVNEPPPRLKTVRPSIPAALDDVIAEALTVDVDKRIATAAEFRRRLAAAWKSQGELADTAEVGEFVSLVSAQKLEARQEQISRVLRLRAGLAKVNAEAALAAADRSSSSGLEAPVRGAEDTTSAISASSLSAADGAASAPLAETRTKRDSRWVALGGAAVGVVGIASAVWALATRGAPNESAARQTATPAVEASGQGAAPPAAPTSATTSPKPVERVAQLTIHSDAALRSLELDGAPMKLTPNAREVKLPLPPGHDQRSFELRALSTDGRRLQLEIEPGTERVSLEFPVPSRGATSPATPPQVVPDSAKPKKPAELPGLAPTPYDKK